MPKSNHWSMLGHARALAIESSTCHRIFESRPNQTNDNKRQQTNNLFNNSSKQKQRKEQNKRKTKRGMKKEEEKKRLRGEKNNKSEIITCQRQQQNRSIWDGRETTWLHRRRLSSAQRTTLIRKWLAIWWITVNRSGRARRWAIEGPTSLPRQSHFGSHRARSGIDTTERERKRGRKNDNRNINKAGRGSMRTLQR